MPLIRSLSAACAMALVGAFAAPSFGATGLKTFDDWIIGCDNGLACRAIGTAADDDSGGPYIVIDRASGPEGRTRIRFGLAGALVGGPDGLVIRVDGGSPLTLQGASFDIMDPDRDDRGESPELASSEAVVQVVERLRGGRELRFGATAPRADSPAVSLNGLMPALGFMDEIQGR
jgi:Protein of unknown function (DUF1176)